MSQRLDFSYAWQTRWSPSAPLSPVVEIYGDTGPLGSMPRFSQQQLLAGPVALGQTDASALGTLRWRLEVEIPL